MYAYDEIYLEDACSCLGEALDYVSNGCQMDMEVFFDLFIAGGYAKRFGEGDCSLISGLSGTELVRKVMYECGLVIAFPNETKNFKLSSEYKCGSILAHLQWYSGRSFSALLGIMSISEVMAFAMMLENATDAKRMEAFDELLKSPDNPNRLANARKICGYSQRELSEKAGVNLRTLQQYEARAKDINKAAFSTLVSLSRTLGRIPEELMELEKDKENK